MPAGGRGASGGARALAALAALLALARLPPRAALLPWARAAAPAAPGLRGGPRGGAARRGPGALAAAGVAGGAAVAGAANGSSLAPPEPAGIAWESLSNDGEEAPSWDEIRGQESGAVESWKRELLRFCAASNRGLGASREDVRRVTALAEKLEGSFRAPQGSEKRLEALTGSWAIIFTTSPDLTSLRTLPLPGWSTERIGQSFRSNMDATNEIEFVSPLGSRVDQTVQCKWKLVEPGAEKLRVELLFAGSSTRLREVMGFEPPVPPLTLPLPPAAGVFEVSFVDEDLLVQRLAPGRRGPSGVNILVRQ